MGDIITAMDLPQPEPRWSRCIQCGRRLEGKKYACCVECDALPLCRSCASEHLWSCGWIEIVELK